MRASSERRFSLGLTGAEVLVLAGIAALLVGTLSGKGALTSRRAEDACISNIRSICAAIRMYLSDHDGVVPPREENKKTIAYLNTAAGVGGKKADGEMPRVVSIGCRLINQANPYLRWPVVLDSYVGTRVVWRCPSARLEARAAFINGATDWLAHLRRHEGEWGRGKGVSLCMGASWPSGWGGDVTDSLTQGKLAGPAGAAAERVLTDAFVQSIGVNAAAAGERAAELPDPEWFVVCADAGTQTERFGTGTLAYPDICALECANEACGWVDWEECTWAAECGLYHHAPKNGSFLRRVELRRPYSRHRGGVSIGCLDGHAAWFDSE